MRCSMTGSGLKGGFDFVTYADSCEGAFRDFASDYSDFLKPEEFYTLSYRGDGCGYRHLVSAFWSGSAFVLL